LNPLSECGTQDKETSDGLTGVATALNAALVVAALVMIKQSTPATPLQGNELTVEELDAILGDAVSIIQKLDIGNKMLDKCSRFLSTLRDLVSGCQYGKLSLLSSTARCTAKSFEY
jgi:hypothetical protein